MNSGMIWSLCDWLNKVYSFYMAAVVDIILLVGKALN